ncbi:hypothetical protein DPEC_G00115930 [Dallia pectoralis]|uniref:Uncharacterized protein n=1 Tax=Dallia pectoralis TaxID=75939 RepID=A0ACC2GV59_DALPE|nr:hypothetical protein DPEC_G00115930 [Dallia pectoralis]
MFGAPLVMGITNMSRTHLTSPETQPSVSLSAKSQQRCLTSKPVLKQQPSLQLLQLASANGKPSGAVLENQLHLVKSSFFPPIAPRAALPDGGWVEGAASWVEGAASWVEGGASWVEGGSNSRRRLPAQSLHPGVVSQR